MLFSWKEIYVGFSNKTYNQIMNLLEDHKIKTKVKITTNRDRVTRNLVLGADPISMNTRGFAETNREYKILVRKADFEEAQYIISNQINK